MKLFSYTLKNIQKSFSQIRVLQKYINHKAVFSFPVYGIVFVGVATDEGKIIALCSVNPSS